MNTNRLRAAQLAAGMASIVACHHATTKNETIEDPPIDPKVLAQQPQLGSLVTAAKAPPPIQGGTLTASKTAEIAVASDLDRDRIYVIDLAALNVKHTIQLAAGAEPGRVELDEKGFAYVVLRGTNQLATVDLATGAIDYRATCNAPRGVAYDAVKDTLFVTCAVGDLMSFPRAGASSNYWARFGEDLRDVVIGKDRMHVTGFRKAQLYAVYGDPGQSTKQGLDGSVVAWRARKFVNPDRFGTRSLLVAQDTVAPDRPVSTQSGGYTNAIIDDTGTCPDPIGIVSTRVFLTSDICTDSSCTDSVRLPSAVLPVDVATNGDEVFVVAAGNAFSDKLPQLFGIQAEAIAGKGTQDCVPTSTSNVPGQAIAADFSAADELLVQTREPAALHVMTTDRQRVLRTITLATDSVKDTGHEVFHANSGGGIACASCHAEGGDDSHVWTFDNIGPRRTPSLRGTVQGTAPYHWNGDQRDMTDIVNHVFVKRMSGPQLKSDQIDALQNYLFALPAPQAIRSADDQSARGKALFDQRCASCHAGSKLTDNATIDVGTGGKFQVPSLVGVGWRGPWIHDGCAKTLHDRFTCGGDKHADLRGLGAPAIDDIVAYLETL